MGLEMESDFDFDNKCSVDLSPNTVLPSLRQCSSIEKRGKPIRRDNQLNLKDEFTENSFGRYRSSSCKNIPSRLSRLEGNVELKRGSIYQSSREISKIKERGNSGERKKIEMPCGSHSALSFRIVDSLCSSDEESPRKGSPGPGVSFETKFKSSSVKKNHFEPCSSDGFIDVSLNSDIREKVSAQNVRRDSMDSFKCHAVIGPINNGNEILDRDLIHKLHKSFSAKVGVPHSPSSLESDHSSKGNSKTRFSPIRKMFDPFMKSKSLRSPLGYMAGPVDEKDTSRNRTYRKSLLPDFSKAAQSPEFGSPQFVKIDNHHSVVSSSPIHLHASLKMQNRHGMPFFEFSLNSPEDVFVAKTWKTDNAFSWVYTFHSLDGRKKSNSVMVGQMHVSCYLSSDLRDGVFYNSMVTEFVSYDTSRARKSTAAKENCNSTADAVKPSKILNPGSGGEAVKLENGAEPIPKIQQRHTLDNGDCDSSNVYPLATKDLLPNLETAAIVMQIPFDKRESLKYKKEDKKSDKMNRCLLNLSRVEQKKDKFPESRSSEKVKVVIPTGNHGLPTVESQGPSPLLERWRLGGGCDCGGWDMACPLVIMGNPYFQSTEDRRKMENQWPSELFIQGEKESTLALTMSVVEDGHYNVDFHARLSALQAFSICVALLHGTEACAAACQEKHKQLSQCSSLKMLIEEEAMFLIDAVMAEEKRKAVKIVKENAPSYVVNPPFSPIARV